MDLKMKVEEKQTTGKVWDCDYEGGLVPVISDGEEDRQCALIAAFLVKGTVPLLADAGVPWTEYLSKKMTFGELDFYIRDSMQSVGKPDYYPMYDIENGKLTVSIGKIQE